VSSAGDARGRGTRDGAAKGRIRASLRTDRGFTWIAWERVAPPGASRTPEPRRRDPLVQPQLFNSWLYAAREIRRFVGARGIRGLDAEGRCGRANDGPGRARSGVCHRSSTRVALCGLHGALSVRGIFKRVNYVSTWEISSARPNARRTAFVTETHTHLGK
jgi:hypothetical protein